MTDLIIQGFAYKFLSALTILGMSIIGSIGYTGVFVLMFLESANFPIVPSEITMVFAGSLVPEGIFNFWIVAIVGALGNLAGAIFAYFLGYQIGRPVIDKWGHYLMINKENIREGEEWLKKYHEPIIFFSRLTPIIKAFISIPAGILRISFKKFVFYTFVGSLIWSTVLTYTGLKLGENWQNIEPYFKKADWLILGLLFIGLVWFTHHLFRRKDKALL